MPRGYNLLLGIWIFHFSFFTFVRRELEVVIANKLARS